MNGQQTVRRTMLGRLAVGLLAVAAVGLLAPVAAATPQDDADAAITDAWQAAGGDTGPLAPKDGGVYPAGEGFGQDFPGGKIFFTPATGAHIMTGAILDKYMSLGGPADGDLGFPTIDEGAGKAPDRAPGAPAVSRGGGESPGPPEPPLPAPGTPGGFWGPRPRGRGSFGAR